MTFSIFLDIVVVVLLLAAIGVALVLNQRLAAFRAARGEFEQIIERFNTAATRAESGVTQLRMSSAEQGGALQKNIVTARALRDELTFLVERCEPLIDRLGGVARASQPRVAEAPKPAPPAPAPKPAAPAAAAVPGKPSDTDLLKYLSSLR